MSKVVGSGGARGDHQRTKCKSAGLLASYTETKRAMTIRDVGTGFAEALFRIFIVWQLKC